MVSFFLDMTEGKYINNIFIRNKNTAPISNKVTFYKAHVRKTAEAHFRAVEP